MSKDYFSKKISLQEGEEIIAILHHHPVTYWKQILITAFLILLAFFLMFLLFSIGPFGVALFAAILATGLIYGLREFFIWFNNVFVITNKRIFDFDQKGFFNKTVSEVDYSKILDISYTVKGVSQTILKLGTIKVKAAGATLVLKNISNIVKINQLITDLIREATGKEIAAKKVKQLNGKEKEKLAEEFLNQEELAEYENYKLNELIEEYRETFGELSLKKILVDELEKHEEDEREPSFAKATEDKEQEELEGKETESLGNFRKKRL